MKKSTKIITTIVALCLVVSAMVFGIYAAISTSQDTSVSISYRVNEVAVHVYGSVFGHEHSSSDYDTISAGIEQSLPKYEGYNDADLYIREKMDNYAEYIAPGASSNTELPTWVIGDIKPGLGEANIPIPNDINIIVVIENDSTQDINILPYQAGSTTVTNATITVKYKTDLPKIASNPSGAAYGELYDTNTNGMTEIEYQQGGDGMTLTGNSACVICFRYHVIDNGISAQNFQWQPIFTIRTAEYY